MTPEELAFEAAWKICSAWDGKITKPVLRKVIEAAIKEIETGEVERLRAALEQIVSTNQVREFMGDDKSDGYGNEGWVVRDGQSARIARAALSQHRKGSEADAHIEVQDDLRIAETRAAALEEAAKICDGARDNLVVGELPHGVAVALAAAIRALIPREG